MKKIANSDKIIKQFEEDWENMNREWDNLHIEHRHDTQFTWFNKQWSAEAIEDRKGVPGPEGTPPRPINVFNILKPYIIKVCNGIKKLKMGIKVAPIDSGEDKDIAEVYRGLQRAIERNTGAIAARDHATSQAVTGGYGFYAFETDYEDPKSHNQELKYRIIHDATNVLWDEGDRTLDGSGVKKVIYREPITKDEFELRFGEKWEDVYEAGGPEIARSWGTSEQPMISEYWYVEEKPEVLVRITTGDKEENLFMSEAKERFKDEQMPVEAFLDTDDEGEYIQRESHSRKVYCCKMAGRKVLSKDLWAGYWIPWFKVEGRLSICDGDVIREGLARPAKPSQECYNYSRNSAIERLGLSTKLSWITAEGSIPQTEKAKWGTSNTRNWPNLTYSAYDDQQRPLPPPSRTPPADIDVGHVQEAQTSQGEIMSEMGLYGAYTGNTNNEKSGRAILAGAQESADIVFDFADNKSKTMKHEGRVRNELIPKVYDTPRQVRMVGEDDAEKVVMVNAQARDENGKDYYYDLKKGKYDITIEMGPNEEEKRLESREGMEMYMKALPNFAPFIADIYAKEQNWRYSEEVANRAKNWIQQTNPAIIEDKDGPTPEVRQLQQQMKQMQQQAMQVIQEKNEQIKTLESKQQIEMAKLQEQKAKNEEDNEVDIYNAETNRMKVRNDDKKNFGNERLSIAKLKTDIFKQEHTNGTME